MCSLRGDGAKGSSLYGIACCGWLSMSLYGPAGTEYLRGPINNAVDQELGCLGRELRSSGTMESKQHKFETVIWAITASMMSLTDLTCLSIQHTPTYCLRGLVHQVDMYTSCCRVFRKKRKE
jgi:hypothetical protein